MGHSPPPPCGDQGSERRTAATSPQSNANATASRPPRAAILNHRQQLCSGPLTAAAAVWRPAAASERLTAATREMLWPQDLDEILISGQPRPRSGKSTQSTTAATAVRFDSANDCRWAEELLAWRPSCKFAVPTVTIRSRWSTTIHRATARVRRAAVVSTWPRTSRPLRTTALRRELPPTGEHSEVHMSLRNP